MSGFLVEDRPVVPEPIRVTAGSGDPSDGSSMLPDTGKRVRSGRWLAAGAGGGALFGLVAIVSPMVAVGMMAVGGLGYAVLDLWPNRRS